MKIPPDLEPQVRRILHGLAADETLSTADLAGRIAGLGDENKAARNATMTALGKLGQMLPGLCTRGEPKAYMGRMVQPRIWHHLSSPDVPSGTVQLAGMRRGDTAVRIAGGNPRTQSLGPAGPASLLVDRVQRVEDWITQRDPLFRVL